MRGSDVVPVFDLKLVVGVRSAVAAVYVKAPVLMALK